MKQKFQVFSLLVLALFQFSNTGNAQDFFKQHPQINPYQYTVVKEQSFQKAAVTSAHPLASMVGAAMMKDGGNAYDAAIAVQFTLAVVFPAAGNIGGGGFLLSRNKEGVLMGIDFREAAPSKGHRDMYLDEKGNPKKVKPWVPKTDQEKKLQEYALKLKTLREEIHEEMWPFFNE